MRKNIVNFLLAALCLMLFAPGAKAQTTPYQPGVTASGITYYLPTTKLNICITTKCTTYEPGEYSDYASLYLRLNDVVETSYSEWDITGIKIECYGAANRKEAYSIKFKEKSIAPLVSLAPDGRLLSINEPAQEEDVLTPSSVVTVREDAKNGADYLTQEILSAGSRAKMAELIAAEIYDIRENRSLLSKGQADFMPKDGEQLRLMLEKLEQQERGLLSLFKGTSSETTHVYTFDYTPDSETAADLLFRFSKHFGLTSNDDLGGTPFYISVSDNRTLPDSIPNDGKKKKTV